MNNIRPRHLSTDERTQGALWVGYIGIRHEGNVEKMADEEKHGCRHHPKYCDFLAPEVFCVHICIYVPFQPPAAAAMTAHTSAKGSSPWNLRAMKE